MKKRVLITGENSYIGMYFENYVKNDFEVDTISVKGDDWKTYDMSSYDSIYHVAGIAHVSTDPKMEDLYYKVNRDLTIDVAKKAKEDGVNHFVFMSSIIVYGNATGTITKDSVPNPENFYGRSKLEAEEGLKALETDSFKVAIIRPPMIYGKGSKGNYPRLAKLAKKTPIFPNYPNQRSMLHIDNLVELIKQIIFYGDRGTFYPQNKEYVNTSQLVKEIAKVHGKKVHLTKLGNPLIKLTSKINIVQKMFGDLVYDYILSNYLDNTYMKVNFKDSIEFTEKNGKDN